MIAGNEVPALRERTRSRRPVGAQPFARLLREQAAIGWVVAAGWAAIWVRSSEAVLDQVRTVEDLVKGQLNRFADLADQVEFPALDAVPGVEPMDSGGSSGGRPRLMLVTGRGHGERASGRPEPAFPFIGAGPTGAVFADVIGLCVDSDIRAAR